MKPRLNVVTLGVANMERAKEFYRNALGWEPVDPNDGIAFYAQGGIVFALYPMPCYRPNGADFQALHWASLSTAKKQLTNNTGRSLKTVVNHW